MHNAVDRATAVPGDSKVAAQHWERAGSGSPSQLQQHGVRGQGAMQFGDFCGVATRAQQPRSNTDAGVGIKGTHTGVCSSAAGAASKAGRVAAAGRQTQLRLDHRGGTLAPVAVLQAPPRVVGGTPRSRPCEYLHGIVLCAATHWHSAAYKPPSVV